MLLPGSELLETPMIVQSANLVSVYSRRQESDTAERMISHVAKSERPLVENADHALLAFEWSPPFDSRDSLVINERGLVPIDEVLAFRGVVRRFHYDGRHVTGVIVYPDSAPQVYDQTFTLSPFAFNEVEILVRSLAYKPGLRVVVPLFSEVDRDIEYDTLTVTDHQPNNKGGGRWTIRFADPVITTVYVVEVPARRIIDARTRPRKSGSILHYRPNYSAPVSGT